MRPKLFKSIFCYAAGILLVLGGLMFFVNGAPMSQAADSTAPSASRGGGLVPCGLGDVEKNPGSRCTVNDIFSLVARVTNYLIGVAGIFAVFKIVQNGFNMIVFSGNAESIKKAKGGLINAILGLVLVMMAFGLIYTVIHGIFQIDFNGNILTEPTKYIQETPPPKTAPPAK